MQVREKVEKSHVALFLQRIVAQEGRKVGSLKRRVRRHLEMKNCTPLWREAHLHVKKLKTQMLKKCTPLWREAHFEVKCTKHTRSGPLLEVEMSKKCTPLWREENFEVKKVLKKLPVSDHFWTFRCRFAWQARGILDVVTGEQNVKVL